MSRKEHAAVRITQFCARFVVPYTAVRTHPLRQQLGLVRVVDSAIGTNLRHRCPPNPQERVYSSADATIFYLSTKSSLYDYNPFRAHSLPPKKVNDFVISKLPGTAPSGTRSATMLHASRVLQPPTLQFGHSPYPSSPGFFVWRVL